MSEISDRIAAADCAGPRHPGIAEVEELQARVDATKYPSDAFSDAVPDRATKCLPESMRQFNPDEYPGESLESLGEFRQQCELIRSFTDVVEKLHHPLSFEFMRILVECAALHAKKGSDYGRDNDPFANVRASEEFGIDPWKGAALRGNDKVARIKTHCIKGSLENESVEDSLKDLVNYAAIALTLYREQHGAQA